MYSLINIYFLVLRFSQNRALHLSGVFFKPSRTEAMQVSTGHFQICNLSARYPYLQSLSGPLRGHPKICNLSAGRSSATSSAQMEQQVNISYISIKIVTSPVPCLADSFRGVLG